MGNIIDKTNLIVGKVNVRCPHCESLMKVKTFFFNKIIDKNLFKYVGSKTEKHLEIKNVNCICLKCNQPSRISNGSTIKREKNFIEISSQKLYLLSVTSLLISLIPLFILMNQNYSEKIETNLFFIIHTFLFFTLSSMLFFINKKYPNIELEEDEKQAKDVSLETKIAYIPSIYERDRIQNENKILYETVKLNEQKISRQNTEIINLRPLLTLNTDRQFESEDALKTYIVNNVNFLKFNNKSLSLFKEEGKEKAVEYRTDVGLIDILLTDIEGNFYVIETKLHRIPDKVVGQISRYMGWINQHKNPYNKKVYGIIIGFKHSDKTKYAVKVHPDIYLFEYNNGITFKNID